jgi:hypothetical protein
MANTPATAVVAVYPDHQLNSGGETVATTSFLAGQTRRPAYLQRVAESRRPAYLQRVAEYFGAEATRRRGILARVFDAETVEGVRGALKEATFDYLLVYPDKPPRIDLSCCLTPVYGVRPVGGGLAIYRREK